MVLKLCIFLPPLRLLEALMVASILLGLCTLIFCFYVPLIFCYLLYTLPILARDPLVYLTFSIGYPYFILIVLFNLWCNLLIISIFYLMSTWCFPHLPGLLIAFLQYVVLRICTCSAVVAIFSNPIILYIFLLAPSGVSGGLTMLSLSLGTRCESIWE